MQGRSFGAYNRSAVENGGRERIRSCWRDTPIVLKTSFQIPASTTKIKAFVDNQQDQPPLL